MSDLLQDVRYGCRWLLTHRSFTMVAGLVLALGIAANTAIFTLVNATLLRPPPYPDPDRVVMVWQDYRQRGGPAQEWASGSDVSVWQQQTSIFQHVAAINGWAPALTDPKTEPEQLSGAQVTADYFNVLGVQPIMGRGFTADEDRPGGPRAVILSHALWQRRFNGDPSVVGRALMLSGDPHIVVGIMPAAFRPADVAAQIWRAMQLNPRSQAIVMRALARLRPDISVTQANASLATVAAQIGEQRPERQRVGLVAQRLQDYRTSGVRAALLVLWASVAFVLLIACANIANLLLVRGSTRVREVALRMAIGARRGRIVRQLVTESLLLAIAGGLGGLLLAWWATEALARLGSSAGLSADQIGIDLTTLLFVLGLTMMTALLFGLAPALQISRADVGGALKEGGRGSVVPGGRHARRAFIVAQIALALVLLTGAGLLLRSFMNLYAVDLGFDARQVLTARVLLPRDYREPERQVAFIDQFLAKMEALPDVRAVGVASTIPMGGAETDMDFAIEGRPPVPAGEDGPVTWYRSVSQGYFTALRVPLRSGRLFTDREPAPVVVINEFLAKKYWPGADPLGSRVKFSRGPWFTIVGIVADAHEGGPGLPPTTALFIPYREQPFGGIRVVARTQGDPERIAAGLRLVVGELDRNLPVTRILSMESLLGDAVARPRFLALLIGVFASAALVLAAVGIYGIIAFSVAQRRGEIAVRMALGAERRQVFRLILGEMLRLAAVGVMVGVVGAALAARAIGQMLFGVAPIDPLTFASTALLLGAVAMLAAWLPARRATRIDPVSALRSE